jgi:hypothetical protein
MVQGLIRIAICAMVVLTASVGLTTSASAVTLSYEYSGTGNVGFQSDTTLNLGGTCSSPCAISVVMTIAGTGPTFNPSIPTGWEAGASTTVTDNLGGTSSFAVSTSDFPGVYRETFGGLLLASILPNTLDISTSSFAYILGGLGTVSYSINISLPSGAYVTPLPAALPLFATGLGALALLGWHRRRKGAALIAAS